MPESLVATLAARSSVSAFTSSTGSSGASTLSSSNSAPGASPAGRSAASPRPLSCNASLPGTSQRPPLVGALLHGMFYNPPGPKSPCTQHSELRAFGEMGQRFFFCADYDRSTPD